MLRDDAALTSLAAATDAAERGQSSYWRQAVARFAAAPDGAVRGDTVLGLISRKRDLVHRLGHWVLQAPFRRMGRRFSPFPRCLALARMVSARQGRVMTHDLLRQALSLAAIRHYAPAGEDEGIGLVIGDGFGQLAALMLLDEPLRKVAVINLTKPLLLDLAFVRAALPGIGIALAADRRDVRAALTDRAIRLLAVRADDAAALAAAPIGLAANIVSMQEMDPPVIAEYFRLLRANPARRTLFYCCNKLWKRLPDGNEVRFADYPWRADDRILFDEPCAWSQWIYSARPPFWHYRRGERRVIWHRLAWLAKP